ncbi:MAG: hypothetical protein ABWU84_08870 [Pyrobaculum sp.]|uniref:hypothetical protein n=1 Tax=Pyrobaculum sp. TaxID=2004705 RepID=UPI003EF01A84
MLTYGEGSSDMPRRSGLSGRLDRQALIGGSATPFSKGNYEANYTIKGVVIGGGYRHEIAVGWIVVGSGPSGNYSYGEIMGAGFKAASERDALYVVSCTFGVCTRMTHSPSWLLLIPARLDALKPSGTCQALGYTGALYTGVAGQSAELIGSIPLQSAGNVTATTCVVNGVPLTIRITTTAALSGKPLYQSILDINATRVSPFNGDTYRKILAEVKG